MVVSKRTLIMQVAETKKAIKNCDISDNLSHKIYSALHDIQGDIYGENYIANKTKRGE